MHKPLVSIFSITYNHETYIRQCLEGFVSQETDFSFEVFIVDDASTDATSEIIREYQLKYPGIINPVFHKVNKFKNNLGEIVAHPVLKKMQGKYIAVCEGDDYWTDPLKLQKQVDFLEEHADCSLCYHPCTTSFGDGSGRDYWWGPDKDTRQPVKFSIEELIQSSNTLGMSTLTMLFRRELVRNYPQWAQECAIADLPLKLLLAEHGKIGYLPDNMAIHIRESAPHSWSANRQTFEWVLKDLRATIDCYEQFNRHNHNRYDISVQQAIRKNVLRKFETVLKYGSKWEQTSFLRSYLKHFVTPNKPNTVRWLRFWIGDERFQKLYERR